MGKSAKKFVHLLDGPPVIKTSVESMPRAKFVQIIDEILTGRLASYTSPEALEAKEELRELAFSTPRVAYGTWEARVLENKRLGPVCGCPLTQISDRTLSPEKATLPFVAAFFHRFDASMRGNLIGGMTGVVDIVD